MRESILNSVKLTLENEIQEYKNRIETLLSNTDAQSENDVHMILLVMSQLQSKLDTLNKYFLV
jgi:hypothetical protein